MSLLESTRKDFEALISSASSGDDSSISHEKDDDISSASATISSVKSKKKSPQTVTHSAGIKTKPSSSFWYEEEDLSGVESRKVTPPKRKKSPKVSENLPPSPSSEASESQSEQIQNSVKDDTLNVSCLELTIHETSHLMLDQSVSEILVVVHLVNIETGHYIKSDQVAISPQFTTALKPSDFGSRNPCWNEKIAFHFDDVSGQLARALFLFEIIKLSCGSATDQICQIAWAYLRPISRTGVGHFAPKLRLQLFDIPFVGYFNQPVKKGQHVSNLFKWFKTGQKFKYPATLCVTLNQIQKAENVGSDSSDFTSPARNSRHVSQPFKFPNKLAASYSLETGALVCCFSPDGSRFAAAFTDGTITIYDTKMRSFQVCLKGHRGTVYDLQWADNHHRFDLLSSGADCSARLWNPSSQGSLVLPHPAYVYSSRFNNSCVVTASYDHIIRQWKIFSEGQFQLLKCYFQHTSPVYCLCSSGVNMFSADTQGLILVWKIEEDSLEFQRALNTSSADNVVSAPINWMCVHPSGPKILVQYRAGGLCLLDMNSGEKLVLYNGIHNPRLKLTCSITPCGNYVVAGSEDGSVHWFDLEHGDLLAIVSLQSSDPIMAVSFHPSKHILVLCSLSSGQSLTVLEYDRSVSDDIVGFSLATFPRTVQRAVPSNLSKYKKENGNIQTTPTLNKLERIFRKLDLVTSWSQQ